MNIAWVKSPRLNEAETFLFEEINKNGIAVEAITSTEQDASSNNSTLKITRLKRFGTFNKIPLFSSVIQYFFSINNSLFNFKKHAARFDVLHATENFNSYTYQCVRSGKPTVLTIWENIPFIHEHGRYEHYKKEINQNAAHFIAVSHYSKKMLTIEGIPQNKITVIYPGIDLSRFRPRQKDIALMKRWGLENKKVILSIGSFSYGNKDFRSLLYAFKLLNDPDTVLLIAGKGKQEKYIRSLSIRLGIDKNVKLIGNFPYMSIERLYSLCDVFVLPSFPLISTPRYSFKHALADSLINGSYCTGWEEQFGYVLAEAMACGKPVISTFCGAIPEVIIPNKTGLLVTPGNYYELSNAIQALLEDKNLRKTFGLAGRKLAEERYDAKKVARKYIQVYEQVANTPKT